IVSDGEDGVDGADGLTPEIGTNNNWIIGGVDTGIVAGGQNGASAYDEWLAAGNTGSAQDFLDSLIGASGSDGVDGDDGTDGLTPEIGANGNWFIGTTDTGVVAEGQNGDSAYEEWLVAGNTGSAQDFLDSLIGASGSDGVDGDDGTDGLTPEIGSNGNWFIGTVDTGVVAGGQNGDSAYDEWLTAGNTGSAQDFLDALVGPAGQDGANGTSVTVMDNGDGTVTVSDGTTDVIISDGEDGVDGADGLTPEIGTNNNWIIGGVDTGIVAGGQNGTSAYEEWLAAGNTGSEQDFLDALVGPAGQDGANGTSVTVMDNGDGTVTVSDGTTDAIVSDGADGVDGANGLTPEIGSNGNWFIGTVDTGVVAGGQNGDSAYDEWLTAGNTGSAQDFLDALVGPAGQDGVDGTSVTVTDNGDGTVTVSDGTTDVVVSDGADGLTPEIGTNNNWIIGGVDTGIVAGGQN
ncbi:beta strand repeat-containing protein, partial [Winogradskyella vidalii]|uniref:beta strand repeat-containing protein n=1 Tax=Winogradskyella vidalii TaxID=2615024 RepID=UPI003741E8E2